MATAASAARKLRKSLFDFPVEAAERRPTLLLSLYLLLAIASIIGLKAAGNSLFLDRFSARELAPIYVAVAAVMGLIVPFYLKLSARLPQNRLIIYTQMFLASHLVLFWWLAPFAFAWMPVVVYMWTEIYAVIVTTQVWSLANHIFTTRQARRLFPLVGSGGLLGAALGGLYGREMTFLVGTRNLLLTYVAFLLASAVLVTWLWRRERVAAPPASSRAKQPAPASFLDSVRAIRSSRYLTLMTLLVALSAIVNILVDYQFRYIVEWEFIDQQETARDNMTALFAGFSSYLALFSFLMHLLLTTRIMRWFGLNFAIFVLPLAMLSGSVVLLFSTTLVAGMMIKGFDGVFRHSIDRSSTELLYVPLSAQLKQQAKSFIDMIAGRWAIGFGGVLLFLLVYVWNLSEQQISWVNLALIVPWLGVAWMLREEYVRTLRSSIERKDTSAESLLMELAGFAPSEELTATLASTDERAVESGLGWLQYGQAHAAQSHLASLLTHISPTIRRKAMAVVAAKDLPDLLPQVTRFLYLDDQVESLWQALDYLDRHDPGRSHAGMKAFMEGPHAVLRGTAAARLLASGDAAHREQAGKTLNAFLDSARGPEPAHRQRAAELLGRVPADLECQAVLADFLQDPDPDVVRAAIESAGRTRRHDLVPRLIDLAGDRKLKTDARQALASFGAGILPTLHQALLDRNLPPRVRRNLPRVFSSIGGQEAADYLALCLDGSNRLLKAPVVRALSRIRVREPEVRFDPARITPLILEELRRYYRYLSIRHGVPLQGLSAGASLLGRALKEHLERKIESIFRLVALLYPAKDILDAYHGISSGRRDLRANAQEFLDSVLLNPLRQMLLPILEDRSPERVLEYAREQFGIQKPSFQEALRELLVEGDPWLQSVAIYAAADQSLPGLDPLLEPLANASDELLLETVKAARRRRRSPPVAPPAQAAPASGNPWKT